MKIGSNPAPDTGRFQKRRRMYDLNINETWAFRIIDGPIASFGHMWPTMDEDRTTKVFKPSWKSVCVRKDDTNILDNLAEIDTMLKKKLAEKTGTEAAKSTLRKSDSFNYACIFKNTGKPMAIEVMECNWSVHNQIMQIRAKKDPTKPDFLMYGLTYMYDLVLEKFKNLKTGRPDYKVDVIPGSLGNISGKVEVKYLDAVKFPYPNAESFFTAEELEVIQGCAWELADQYKAVGPDKVLEMLREFPIDLARRQKSNPNQFMFFNGLEDLLAIQKVTQAKNIPVYMPNAQDMQALGVPASPALTQQTQTQPAHNAVDAQYTVVHDQPAAQPAQQAIAAPASQAPAGPYAHTAGAAEKVLPFRENAAASTASVIPPQAQPDQPFNPAPAQGPALSPGGAGAGEVGEVSRPIWD